MVGGRLVVSLQDHRKSKFYQFFFFLFFAMSRGTFNLTGFGVFILMVQSGELPDFLDYLRVIEFGTIFFFLHLALYDPKY